MAALVKQVPDDPLLKDDPDATGSGGSGLPLDDLEKYPIGEEVEFVFKKMITITIITTISMKDDVMMTIKLSFDTHLGKDDDRWPSRGDLFESMMVWSQDKSRIGSRLTMDTKLTLRLLSLLFIFW